MTRRPKRNFSPEFRLEAAQLVVDQNYSVREAAKAMNVGNSYVASITLAGFPAIILAG